MPIRINLLAEAQAAAEARRKNPVKRGIWIGSFLVLVIVIWIGNLQLKIMDEQRQYNSVEKDWNSKMTNFTAVTSEEAKSADMKGKLDLLDALSTNRFLWAPVLDALQKNMVDQVQVTRLKGEQAYKDEPAHTVDFTTALGVTHHIVPEVMIENVSLNIAGKDSKPDEQNYNKFKEALCVCDFFVRRLQRRDGFTLEGTGPLTVDPVDQSKQFRTFTLGAHFPEVRHE